MPGDIHIGTVAEEKNVCDERTIKNVYVRITYAK